MLCFKLIRNNYIESSSSFGDVKSLLTGSTTWRWELIWPQKTVHHWHGTNHWRAPTQSIVNEAQLLTCIHPYNKQRVHTNIHIPTNFTYIDSQGDMFTHITFIMVIMNFRINIILYMWWGFSIDIMMVTITFIV